MVFIRFDGSQLNLGVKHHGLDYNVNNKQVCIAFRSQSVIAATTRIMASKILQDDGTYALLLGLHRRHEQVPLETSILLYYSLPKALFQSVNCVGLTSA